jgi:hypothetical protein
MKLLKRIMMSNLFGSEVIWSKMMKSKLVRSGKIK